MTSARWPAKKLSRHHDQATIRLACVRGDDRFEFGCVVNRRDVRLHGEGRSGGLEGVQVSFGIGRRRRVEQEGDPVDARGNLL